MEVEERRRQQQQQQQQQIEELNHNEEEEEDEDEEEEEEEEGTIQLGSKGDNAGGGKEEAQLKEHEQEQEKEQGGALTQEEVLGNAEIQVSVSPTSLSESSQTAVTQSITSTFSPPFLDKKSSPIKVDMALALISDQQSSAPLKPLSLKTPIPDGYSWRKYGQKQVKSPNGSRSYYRCTYSDCCAKKIECSDHSGHVIEIVNKGTHSHIPPQKNNFTRDSPVALSAGTGIAENSFKRPTLSDLPSSSKESILDKPINSERKRQNLCGSDGNGGSQTKEENNNGPDPKRRMKKGNLPCPETHIKTGKKPKIVVHAAGDVGISADGYRWRKYGQKMVKGNPHPRNYYRCTSAGCPVRKQIETALDNSSAVIITYKGVHDHDMPVPKKRHGPRNATLVSVVAPAPMNNLQLKKADSHKVTSAHRPVGKEGEITRETMDVGGDREKTIESARTLLSIGIEIKQC